jgi:WD40 repeat protein
MVRRHRVTILAQRGVLFLWSLGQADLRRRPTLISMRTRKMRSKLSVTRVSLAGDGVLLLTRWLAVWIALLGCPGVGVCGEHLDMTSARPSPADRAGHVYVNFAAFSPDGKSMMSAGKTLKLWDVASGDVLRTLRRHEDSGRCSKAADGHGCVSARLNSADGGAFTCVAFSPDGRTAVATSVRTTLWDLATGQVLRTLTAPGLEGYAEHIRFAAFSPDGRTVVSAGSPSSPLLWDAASGQYIKAFASSSGSLRSVAFSPDGRTVVSGSTEGTVALWDVATGRTARTLRSSPAVGPKLRTVNSVTFSHDGRSALSGDDDATVRVWDVTTGRLRGAFVSEVPPDRLGLGVFSVAFSPDDRTVVAGYNDGTVKLWDAASGRLLRNLVGQVSDGAWSAAFSPDGRTVLSSAGPILWDAKSGELLKTFTGIEFPSTPPGASPLPLKAGERSDPRVAYFVGLYRGTVALTINFEPKRVRMFRLPDAIGWEQLIAYYQAQLGEDWRADPDETPRGTGLRIKLWKHGDQNFAVALVDEELLDETSRMLFVIDQPEE